MVELARRVCRRCEVEKPITEFYRRGEKDRRQHYRTECKACWKEKTSAWAATNYPRLQWLYKMKNVERKYGISREWYCETMQQQDNKCAACKEDFKGTRGSRSPSVDHCHGSGRVRGILCNGCNLAIGNTNDRPETLRALADYLEAT